MKRDAELWGKEVLVAIPRATLPLSGLWQGTRGRTLLAGPGGAPPGG